MSDFAVKLLLLFVLASCTPACAGTLVTKPPALAVPDLEAPVWSKRYPSGLQVIAEQDLRTQAVAVVLVVGAGSAQDPSGKAGLAHYVEHLAFRSRPTGEVSFRHLLERAGAAEWNAFTDFDQTVYIEVGPKQALPSLLKLEGLRMVNPVAHVAPETYAVELDVVRNELRQRAETGYIYEVLGNLQRAVFPSKHAYAHSVGGTRKSLESLIADDVAAFAKEHYRPENMVLQITGDVDFLKLEPMIAASLPKELLEKNANDTARRANVVHIGPPPEPPRDVASESIQEMEAAVTTPEVWIGWSLPSQYRADGYPPEVIARILSDEVFGLNAWDSDVAQVSFSAFRGREASMLMCRVKLVRGLRPERIVERVFDVIEHVDTPREGLLRVGFDENAFAEQRRDTAISLVLEAESLVRRGVARATLAQATGDPRKYSNQLDEIGKLDRSGAIQLVKTYVRRDRARAVMFKPRTGEKASAPNIQVFASEMEDDHGGKAVDADAIAEIRAGIGPQKFEVKTLENGLQVVYVPRPGMPLVTAHLRFFGGVAEAEDLGAAYGANLVARMPNGFFGNERPGGVRILRMFSDTALIYSATGFSGDVNSVIAALARHINRFSVRTNAWQAFRKEQLPFHEALEKKPEAMAERHFLESLFGGSKWGRRGTTTLVANTTAEQVQNWLNETHSPGNAALVIVGDFFPRTMDPLVQAHLGSWAPSPKVFPPIQAVVPGDKPETEPKLVVEHRPDVSQAQLSFGCLLPPARDKATDVRHDLGAALLENRLRNILRENAGASYDVRVIAVMRRGGTAYLTLEAVVDTSKLVYSLSTIKKGLEDFAQSPIEPQDLARVKLRLARKHSVRYMSNASIAEAVGALKALGLPLATIDDQGSFLAQVTAQDVQADFKACFSGRPTLAMVGNESAIKAAFKDVWQTPATPVEPSLEPPPSSETPQKTKPHVH